MLASKEEDTTKYKISYVTFHPGYRATHLPTQTTTVRGRHARKITCQTIRRAGGSVIKVKRGFWS